MTQVKKYTYQQILDMNEDLTEKLVSAENHGLKTRKICELSGVSDFRIRSIIKRGGSYKYKSQLNGEECEAVYKALETIKSSF